MTHIPCPVPKGVAWPCVAASLLLSQDSQQFNFIRSGASECVASRARPRGAPDKKRHTNLLLSRLTQLPPSSLLLSCLPSLRRSLPPSFHPSSFPHSPSFSTPLFSCLSRSSSFCVFPFPPSHTLLPSFLSSLLPFILLLNPLPSLAYFLLAHLVHPHSFSPSSVLLSSFPPSLTLYSLLHSFSISVFVHSILCFRFLIFCFIFLLPVVLPFFLVSPSCFLPSVFPSFSFLLPLLFQSSLLSTLIHCPFFHSFPVSPFLLLLFCFFLPSFLVSLLCLFRLP